MHLPGTRALRSGRHSRTGQIYLVTFVTWERRRLFIESKAASACVSSLLDGRTWRSSRLLAWVLMPDHWHGLIELGRGDELSHLVRHIKACSARDVRRSRPEIGPVWLAGFHDHALRSDEDLVQVARYVVLNPVRAGLVRRVRDYAYWGAVWGEA
jgi:REP element-mobilizing transposase RayT